MRGFPPEEELSDVSHYFVDPILYENDEVPRALIDGIAYAGSVTLLSGQAKAGKTFCGLQMAMSAARGTAFLGRQTQRCRVLYISLELCTALVRQRMRAICDDVGFVMPEVGREFFLVAPSKGRNVRLTLMAPQGLSELIRIIQHAQAELVFFDTMHRFTLGSDPNDNGEQAEIGERVCQIARETDAALILLDHAPKSAGADHSPAQSAIGAQAKGAMANTVVALKRVDRANGGTFELSADSHFGSWDEAITYRRPVRTDGLPGSGCVTTGVAVAIGVELPSIRQLFFDGADQDAEGRPQFRSQNALVEALQSAGFASRSKQQAMKLVRQIVVRFGADKPDEERPILLGQQRKPRTFTWVGP